MAAFLPWMEPAGYCLVTEKIVPRLWNPKDVEIKGPDNPTCQLLPTSSHRNVKMAWGKQEKEKRW
jgi:hypothetical protein